MGCGDFAKFLFKPIFKTIMSEKKSAIRLSRLTIKNYKKIDYLEIDFPRPLMKDDADILVFGSKNGGGKTSILECCSLLMLAGIVGEKFNRFRESGTLLDIANSLVKAGQHQAMLTGRFEQDDKQCFVSLTIHLNSSIQISRKDDISLFKKDNSPFSIDNTLNSIFAFSSEPLIMPPLLHFNSYRKVQESKPELGMMADEYAIKGFLRSSSGLMRRIETPISFFKLEVLKAVLGKKSVFEGGNETESASVLSQINTLIQRYCGGQIEQLRPLPDNKVDIRIKPNDGGESFSFDGLSSGQKEMIATLFLIWKNTQNQPSVVLVDEPELHLNAEWQSGFVRQLHKLAPNNQYILATHSETIFRSVDRNHRGLLDSNDNGVK
jgi:predicted ATPase